MAVVAGCQEVQGACLEGCLGKACGAFGGFEREGCLGKACRGFGGFEGFEAGQTAALNALKNRCPWCLVSGLPRVGLETLAQGDV